MNTNGGGKSLPASDFQGEKIKFPVTYELKAVLPASNEDQVNKEKIEKVLEQGKIPFSFLRKKVSSKGTYASFTYQVTLNSKDQMDQLYSELKKIDDLKFAV